MSIEARLRRATDDAEFRGLTLWRTQAGGFQASRMTGSSAASNVRIDPDPAVAVCDALVRYAEPGDAGQHRDPFAEATMERRRMTESLRSAWR